ncbi:Alpha/Beta hydrolase protein [Butyriboletus roseoflavus]|nr:Alpha/Beta hydrolase protein [Butyriboletus roseoflavus]
MTTLSALTWGDPTATRHVLLIHGLTSSAQSWYRIAQAFASRGRARLYTSLFDTGYFVTAPDLLGHGNARRGSDYTVAALAEELRPFFTVTGGNDHPYDIVVGHSLGGVVASALLPILKSTRSVHVVLVDPPLESTPETGAQYRSTLCDRVRNPLTPEAFLRAFPSWAREDAIAISFSLYLCDLAAVESIFDVGSLSFLGGSVFTKLVQQNVPWSFSHQLSTAPDNVKVTVLAADPSKAPCVREEDLKPYRHVTAKTVWGASHLIPFEVPQVVVETALGGAESQK